jgi:hypothetical protein
MFVWHDLYVWTSRALIFGTRPHSLHQCQHELVDHDMAEAERSFTCKTSDVRLQHSVNHSLDPMSGQRNNRDKKSCRICTGRKIKCVPVEKYNPRSAPSAATRARCASTRLRKSTLESLRLSISNDIRVCCKLKVPCTLQPPRCSGSGDSRYPFRIPWLSRTSYPLTSDLLAEAIDVRSHLK